MARNVEHCSVFVFGRFYLEVPRFGTRTVSATGKTVCTGQSRSWKAMSPSSSQDSCRFGTALPFLLPKNMVVIMKKNKTHLKPEGITRGAGLSLTGQVGGSKTPAAASASADDDDADRSAPAPAATTFQLRRYMTTVGSGVEAPLAPSRPSSIEEILRGEFGRVRRGFGDQVQLGSVVFAYHVLGLHIVFHDHTFTWLQIGKKCRNLLKELPIQRNICNKN